MGEPRTYLRQIKQNDRKEFLDLMRDSRSLHHPWIAPPNTVTLFDQYIARLRQDDHEGFVVCSRNDDRIAGVINLNNIVRGSFLSASLGYYVGAPFAGRGFMLEGLQQLVRHAFDNLHLHRLEANIQPSNIRSIQLVKRCGFSREGLSPSFLFIAGAWRDHERWSLVHDRQGLRA